MILAGRKSTARHRRLAAMCGVAAICASAAVPVVLSAGQGSSDGWQIGRDATDLANPLRLDDAVLARGRDLYGSKCQRCHGGEGRGNGPDADRDDPPGDLTDARRASRNPDGVLFYKIWNGRSSPKMPAFKTDISRDEVWAVVLFIKTLRRPQ